MLWQPSPKCHHPATQCQHYMQLSAFPLYSYGISFLLFSLTWSIIFPIQYFSTHLPLSLSFLSCFLPIAFGPFLFLLSPLPPLLQLLFSKPPHRNLLPEAPVARQHLSPQDVVCCHSDISPPPSCPSAVCCLSTPCQDHCQWYTRGKIYLKSTECPVPFHYT